MSVEALIKSDNMIKILKVLVVGGIYNDAGEFTSPTAIGRQFDYRHNGSSWACKYLKKLVKLGLVERNDQGHYRSIVDAKDQFGQKPDEIEGVLITDDISQRKIDACVKIFDTCIREQYTDGKHCPNDYMDGAITLTNRMFDAFKTEG